MKLYRYIDHKRLHIVKKDIGVSEKKVVDLQSLYCFGITLVGPFQ